MDQLPGLQRRRAGLAPRHRSRLPLPGTRGPPPGPYEHTEGPYPLGRWLSDQRHTCRTATMTGERAAELEELGVVWDTADHAFDQGLAAARAYHRLHGTLAAPGARPSSASRSGSGSPTSAGPRTSAGGSPPTNGSGTG
ncbi:helicase associated domain-containing protein [Streptomyces lavendulae]|uniref:helicase associated domain-containing protein n=1 Tax=Streptomyces lavendulae TaxID=1914 RepID=UPI000D126870|nr:helicase associated domain-containing protein [Streptomyces lavendulae]